jgi:two-component system, response regulator PdtaR
MHPMTNTEAIPPTVILIVEDEPVIRMHACEIVAGSGQTAVEAGDADEALAILEQRSDIAALFTDVGLPGDLDGIQLAKLVRKRWPNTAVLLTSGAYGGPLPYDIPFLGKPYVERQVRDALKRLLPCH